MVARRTSNFSVFIRLKFDILRLRVRVPQGVKDYQVRLFCTFHFLIITLVDGDKWGGSFGVCERSFHESAVEGLASDRHVQCLTKKTSTSGILLVRSGIEPISRLMGRLRQPSGLQL